MTSRHADINEKVFIVKQKDGQSAPAAELKGWSPSSSLKQKADAAAPRAEAAGPAAPAAQAGGRWGQRRRLAGTLRWPDYRDRDLSGASMASASISGGGRLAAARRRPCRPRPCRRNPSSGTEAHCHPTLPAAASRTMQMKLSRPPSKIRISALSTAGAPSTSAAPTASCPTARVRQWYARRRRCRAKPAAPSKPAGG